jgi:hypothetical protein
MHPQNRQIKDYARCVALGTWRILYCEHCGADLGGAIDPPIPIEWQRGSTCLADITDTGNGFLVNEKAKEFFNAHSSSIVFTEPEYIPSKYKRNVIKPENLPPLWWMRNQVMVNLDVTRSALEESDRSCEKTRDYDFKMRDLFFLKATFGNSSCFHVVEFGASCIWFCTEDFVQELNESGLTGVRFEECGIAI